MEDKDFEAFLTQLRSNTPDLSVIKDGIEKFGSGALSDSQKETFKKALYPDLSGDFTTSSQAQGFENVSSLKNLLKAIVEIQKDEQNILSTSAEGGTIKADKPTLTAETIQSLLAPEGGKNALDTLIINTYAADFKSGQITDEDTLKILNENKKEYNETLEIFSQIDPQSLQKLLEISRNGEYKAIINSPYYSPSINTFVSSASEKIAKADEGITIEETGTTKVGGEGVTITPTDREGVNIAPIQEDQTKTANMVKAPGDHGKDKYKPEIVKEQDIIKYMFEKWFLEFMVSGTINLANKIVNGAVNYLAEHLEMPVKQAEYITPNSASAKYLKTAAKNLESACDDIIKPQNTFYKTMQQCISQNAGIDPSAWNIASLNGQPILSLDNPRDKALMENYKALYDADPKKFKEQMAAMDDFLKSEKKDMTSLLKSAATLALVKQLSANIDKDFGEADEAKARTNMLVIADQIQDNLKVIAQKTEMDYRIAHHLAPDAELSQEDKVAVLAGIEQTSKDYMDKLATQANNAQKNLKKYYTADTEADKEKCKNDINEANISLANLLEGHTEIVSFKSAEGKTMTLKEAGEETARATAAEPLWQQHLFSTSPEAVASTLEANNKRKEQFIAAKEEKFPETVGAAKEIVKEKKREATLAKMTEQFIMSQGPSGMFR